MTCFLTSVLLHVELDKVVHKRIMKLDVEVWIGLIWDQ